jgi:hypothetical protein
MPVTFVPGSPSAQQATVQMTTSSPTCAPLPNDLVVRGTGTGGIFLVDKTGLKFGNNPCNATPPGAQTVGIGNSGNASLNFTATVTSGDFTVSPASGSLQAGAGIQLHVAPVAVGNATPGPVEATLIISTDVVGDVPHYVTLWENIYGAILTTKAQSLVLPDTQVNDISFGKTLAFVNSGNAPAYASFTMTGDPSLTIGGLYVAPGSSGAATTAFSPTVTGIASASATVQPVAGAAFCADLPNASILLSGTGVADPPTYTDVSELDFGLVTCGGSAAPAQVVRVVNPSDVAQTFNASFFETSPVYDLAPASGTIPAQGYVDITVTPHPVVVDEGALYGDNVFNGGLADVLVVTTSTDTLSVPIYETGYGEAYAWVRLPQSMAALDKDRLLIDDLGNIQGFAVVELLLGGAASSDLTLSNGQATVSWSGASLTDSVSYAGGHAGETGTIQVVTTNPVCYSLAASSITLVN